MSSKKQEEKHLKILRSIASLPPNKTCMNCKEKGPVWICLNFDTFVCTTCSGIHREFNHRIKSISMATFSPEEIKRVQDNNGNEYARKVWLSKWSPSDFPVPEAGDRNRIKEFIKLCYQDKKWYQESAPPSSSHASDSDELPPQMPISKIIQNPPSLVVKPTEAQKKKDDDLLGMYDPPANPQPQQQPDFFNAMFNTQGQGQGQPQTPQDKYAEAVAAIKNTQIQQQQQLNPWANSQPVVQQTPWGYQPTGMTYPPPQFPGQQFPGQQFPGQQFPGQQFPGQPFPGQQYPVQGYPGQPYMQQAGPFPGQVYPQQQQQQQQQFHPQQFSPPQPSFPPQSPAPVQQPTAFMNANNTNSAPSSFVQEPPKGGDKYDVFSSLAMFPSSTQPAAAGNSGNPFGNSSYGNKSTQQNSQQGNPFAPASTQQPQQKQPFNPFV